MIDNLKNLYDDKDKSYYGYARTEIISLIPGRGLKVLDIGCGKGATLMELKKSGKAAQAVGIEINQEAAAAAGPLLDDVIVGNIEDLVINYPAGHFDVIIMADVLEHLVDPWSAISKVRRHLDKDGLLIASLPNLREFSTISALLFQGDFRYAGAGILDRSHLRFFCKKNMVELFRDGFEITEIRSIPELAKGEMAWLNKLTCRIFEEFLVTQYIIVARNKTASAPIPGGTKDG